MAEVAEATAAEAPSRVDLGRALTGPVLLRERFQIDPATPLPQFDLPSAKAFAVEDRRDTGRALFALVCNPGLPLRSDVMAQLKGSAVKGVLPLVDYGAVDWSPIGQRTMAVIYEKPLGGRFAELPWARDIRFSEHDLPKRLMEPIVGTLARLAARNIVHRAIRPDNLFYLDAERQMIVLGDCVTAPAGHDQPLVFETIDRGLVAPAGRGEGGVTEDVYALAVSLVFIALADNPIAKLTDDELLRAKIEQGSYGAICGRERIPLPLIEPVRGMLSDETNERWGIDELEHWLGGKRLTPPPKKSSPKADNPFEFMGEPHATPRTLAHAFSQNAADAAKTIKAGGLEHWLRRQLNDAELANAVAELVVAAKAHEADPLGSDDYLVAKVCIFLDRKGPIRYKGFSFMPDGFGPATAVELLHAGNTQIPAEVLLRDIPSLWFAAQPGFKPGVSLRERTFNTLRGYLLNNEIGYGAERCLYELTPGLPCQSPLVIAEYVHEIGALLPALDRVSNRVDTKSKPIDRHIAAFIAAHIDTDVEDYLEALGDSDPKTAVLGMLSLIALLQWRQDVGPLFGLASWVGGQLGPAINSYHSRTARRALEREMPRLIRAGNLNDIYGMIENKERRRVDSDGFNLARAQHAAAQAEINEIEGSDTARSESAEEIGRQTAAMAAVILSLIVVTLIYMFHQY